MFSWLFRRKKEPAPITIGVQDLFELIERQLNTVCPIRLADRSFTCISPDNAWQIATKAKTTGYSFEKWDCDDIAMAVAHQAHLEQKCLAIGIAWTVSHAFNLFVSPEKEIWLLDATNGAPYIAREVPYRDVTLVLF